MPFWSRRSREAGPAAAEPAPARTPGGPDLAHVTSLEQARHLADIGQLEELLLLPEELGGQRIAPNIVYVPIGVGALRDENIMPTIFALLGSGDIDRFSCSPTYRGDSFIPATLEIHTHHSERPGGGFHPELAIW